MSNVHVADLIDEIRQSPAWRNVKNPLRVIELYGIWESRHLTDEEVGELERLGAGPVPVSKEKLESVRARAWAEICEGAV